MAHYGTPLPSREEVGNWLKAYELDQLVIGKLEALNKGKLLSTILLVTPIATTIISVIGGFYSVYSSSDCEGTKFKGYSRALLYTSTAWTVVNIAMDTVMKNSLRQLIANPGLAFGLYCGQAAVTIGFFAVLLSLFVMVVKTACPSVRRKVNLRLS